MPLPSPHSLRALRLVLRVILYLWVGWGGYHFRRWTRRRREQNAAGWPIVEGGVLSGKVRKIRKTRRYMATLSYFYFVGEYHCGEYQQEFKREADADEFIRQMNGKRVMVRYRELRPSRSLLESRMVEQVAAFAPTRS